MRNSSSSSKRKSRSWLATKAKAALRAVTLGCISTSFNFEDRESGHAAFLEADEKAHLGLLPALYAPTLCLVDDKKNTNAEYDAFLRDYPQYALTSKLDELRGREFTRLTNANEAYVDYMGGSLYPESLLRSHMAVLHQNVMGNTHSINNPYVPLEEVWPALCSFVSMTDYLHCHRSHLSGIYAAEARKAVLSFFNAPPGYTVVFTANASGALKLVGESFPFAKGGCYVLGADSHNSVHGIRQFALNRGADVHYIESTAVGGVDLDSTMVRITVFYTRYWSLTRVAEFTGES